jgi:hypothetical protein
MGGGALTPLTSIAGRVQEGEKCFPWGDVVYLLSIIKEKDDVLESIRSVTDTPDELSAKTAHLMAIKALALGHEEEKNGN